MYERDVLIDLSKIPMGNKSTEMQILLCYILNNIRFVMLCANQNSVKETSQKKKLTLYTSKKKKK